MIGDWMRLRILTGRGLDYSLLRSDGAAIEDFLEDEAINTLHVRGSKEQHNVRSRMSMSSGSGIWHPF